MPHSGVNPQELFEMEKVKMIKTDNKLYFGQIENKKKNGIGTQIVIDRHRPVSARQALRRAVCEQREEWPRVRNLRQWERVCGQLRPK